MTDLELAEEIDKFWKELVKSSIGEGHDYCHAATISKNAFADTVSGLIKDRHSLNGMATLLAQSREIIAALRRGPERPPSGEMVMVLKSFAENRCYACCWPLAGSATNGCTPFNCSYRPDEQSVEHAAWLKKAHEMERVRAMLSAAEAEGRKG